MEILSTFLVLWGPGLSRTRVWGMTNRVESNLQLSSFRFNVDTIYQWSLLWGRCCTLALHEFTFSCWSPQFHSQYLLSSHIWINLNIPKIPSAQNGKMSGLLNSRLWEENKKNVKIFFANIPLGWKYKVSLASLPPPPADCLSFNFLLSSKAHFIGWDILLHISLSLLNMMAAVLEMQFLIKSCWEKEKTLQHFRNF